MIDTLLYDLFNDYGFNNQNYVKDKGDSFELKVELAGFSKEDVDIEATEDRLTIKTNPEGRKKTFSVQLFKKVETESITCEMDNGLLIIDLPKKGRSKPTKIKVN
jgi:HSP20 family molecular chaperone IbpA